jgi:hypothetical protein
LHKAFLRYHDPKNWDILRQALRQMGRSDLIGNGEEHLVPYSRAGNTLKSQLPRKNNNDFHHTVSLRHPRSGASAKLTGKSSSGNGCISTSLRIPLPSSVKHNKIPK